MEAQVSIHEHGLLIYHAAHLLPKPPSARHSEGLCSASPLPDDSATHVVPEQHVCVVDLQIHVHVLVVTVNFLSSLLAYLALSL